MSLTKEEIFDFVSDYLYEIEDGYYEKTIDDHIIRTLGKFLSSHGFNPSESHDFTFFTRKIEEPWEFIKFDITWEPEIVLGVGEFEYRYVRIGVAPKKEGAGRPRTYIFKGGAGISIK